MLQTIEIEVRLFNSLSKYPVGGMRRLARGALIGELIRQLQIPQQEIYLVLLNGHNIMQSLGGEIEPEHLLQQGDVVALSGPVPYSRAYGGPVV